MPVKVFRIMRVAYRLDARIVHLSILNQLGAPTFSDLSPLATALRDSPKRHKFRINLAG